MRISGIIPSMVPKYVFTFAQFLPSVYIPAFMKLRILIIGFFVSLNLVLGFLFQQLTDFSCFTELLIIAGTGITFWWFVSKWVSVAATQWQLFKNVRNFLLQAGIGLSAGFANALITSGIMFLIVLNCDACTAPELELLNGTFTNNLMIHLLCYFSLVFSVQQQSEKAPKTQAASVDIVELSSGNKTYQCRLRDVRYLETSNNCIILHTQAGNFVRYQSLRSFLEEYQGTSIRRVHRFYAVNMDQVQYYEKNKNGDGWLTLVDHSRVKFSRSYFNGIN